MDQTQRFAQKLHAARLEAREVERLTLEAPELSIPQAYEVQEAGMALRFAAGETQVGLKMGLTSEAKRQQMSLEAPVYGVLTDRMQVPDGGVFALPGSIHPRVEPEIAFRTSRALRGRISLEEAAAACDGVGAALEIIDSRYRNFKYFSLPDVIADNSSSSMFVVAARFRPLAGFALDRLEMVLFINGETKQSAESSAISGHPLISLVQLCELLDARGQGVPAGSIVLAGGATAAESVHAGDRVELRVGGLDSVSMTCR